MWVDQSNGEDKKHQYFRHFTRKEMKKMEDNIQGWSWTLGLHARTISKENEEETQELLRSKCSDGKAMRHKVQKTKSEKSSLDVKNEVFSLAVKNISI